MASSVRFEKASQRFCGCVHRWPSLHLIWKDYPTVYLSCLFEVGNENWICTGLIALAVQTAGCAKSATDFEMPAEKIDVFQGFIVKGISISGEVKSGCIANEDEFIVKKEGKEILRTTTRILNIHDLKDPDAFNGQAAKGDYVTLYIPDGKEGDVSPGDM